VKLRGLRDKKVRDVIILERRTLQRGGREREGRGDRGRRSKALKKLSSRRENERLAEETSELVPKSTLCISLAGKGGRGICIKGQSREAAIKYHGERKSCRKRRNSLRATVYTKGTK